MEVVRSWPKVIFGLSELGAPGGTSSSHVQLLTDKGVFLGLIT